MTTQIVNRTANRLGILALAVALFAAACTGDSLEVQTDDPGTDPTPTETPDQPEGPDEPETPSEPGPSGTTLDDAEAMWENAGPADYDMIYREVCFCPEIKIMVTVRDGQVTETTSLGELDPERDGRTVESLFAEIRQAIDDGAASVNVEYDPELGYPTSYFIDFSLEMADEEFGITVESLTPVG